MSATEITKTEAAKALRAVAFKVTDEEDSAYGRTLVHCMRGFTGADWDLDDALELVEQATWTGWVDHLVGHDLQVVTDTGDYWFDAKRTTNQ